MKAMSDNVLSSLAEAQAIFRKHVAEQKAEGRKKQPDAWLSCPKDRLVIIVYGAEKDGTIQKPYEYKIGFECEGVHLITTPPRKPQLAKKKKTEAASEKTQPPRQLHMFKPG
jgi:hypothetical protein